MEYKEEINLCRSFFRKEAKPIIDKYFPEIKYSAGMLGKGCEAIEKGSISGPFFYLIIRQKDVYCRTDLYDTLNYGLPESFWGYPAKFVKNEGGKPQSLVIIRTFEELMYEELGIYSLNFENVDWITLPEDRLRNLVKVELFEDQLKIICDLAKIIYYPDDVKRYLVASQWNIIAMEREYLSKRKDEIDSVLLCSKIVERLMRLCFLYCETYAPKNDCFGVEFRKLDIDYETKNALHRVLIAETSDEREELLEQAQKLVANIHNRRRITPQKVELDVITRNGKMIRVAKAEKFAEVTRKSLWGSVYEHVPLIGSLSQLDGPSLMTENHLYFKSIRQLYF